ncbi:lia operon protein LiaF [Evansella caseinilytica]|uniref:Lia operon protein LiaF n=1 Tax=Evansella caseinilytica TaxID=1503961 RepID=A0A1H3PIX4_9BACI|nr:cell wall-active antibiotics response protein LiaF [Evansella caseinilytica]SDZ01027.1 lia operon protein LiaF [Evansella caseinilytica]
MKRLIGLLVLAVGLIFLLSNIGMIDLEATNIFSTFWPAIIVLIGLKVFFEGLIYFFHSLRRDKWQIGKCLWGTFITAAGVILLGNNAGWFTFGFSDLWSWTWPALVVYIGLKIIFDRGDIVIRFDRDRDNQENPEGSKKHEHHRKLCWHGNRHKHHQFIGDIQLGKQPFELDCTELSIGIGSVEIDLTKAILKEGDNVVDIRCGIGSVEILVPKEMAVKADVNVRLGDATLFDNSYAGTSRHATYMSADFHEAEKKVLLNVSLNIGDVEVLTVD